MNPHAVLNVTTCYDHIASIYDDLFSEYIHNLRQDLDELTAAIGTPLPCDDALELGCGSGALTEILAERCQRVTGIDISEVMLSRLRDRFRDSTTKCRINVIKADATDLPSDLKRASFSLVVFWGNGISHIPPADYDTLADNISEALSDGGYFLFNYRDGEEWAKNVRKMEKITSSETRDYYYFIYNPADPQPGDLFEAAIISVNRHANETEIEIIEPCLRIYFCDFKKFQQALKKHGIEMIAECSAHGLDALRSAVFKKTA